MKYLHLTTLALLLFASLQGTAYEAAKKQEVIRLYQVGKDGYYCLSLTREVSGCVSGVDSEGNTINVFDIIKGKQVVFENLSDSPHDMKFSGANAEDLPAQQPNGALVEKQMNRPDMNAQKITCSYHGDQLAVGYRVPDEKKNQAQRDGHKRPEGEADFFDEKTQADPTRPTTRTGLADVGLQVMAKGRPADVEKLLATRPDLLAELEKVRPALAEEITARKPEIAAARKASELASGKAADSKVKGTGVAAGTEGGAAGDAGRVGFLNTSKLGAAGAEGLDAKSFLEAAQSASEGAFDETLAGATGQNGAGAQAKKSLQGLRGIKRVAIHQGANPAVRSVASQQASIDYIVALRKGKAGVTSGMGFSWLWLLAGLGVSAWFVFFWKRRKSGEKQNGSMRV